MIHRETTTRMTELRPTWTILGMMEWATGYFDSRRVDQPRLSIEWLLSHVLGVPRLNLYLQHDRPLSAGELDALRPLVKRRSEHEPLQYIVGTASFMGRDFVVDDRVLIPRPETEELVERILAEPGARGGDPDSELRLIDLGTGSGCIPITVKLERSSWICTGIDLSTDALEIARINAGRLGADVLFLQGDMTSAPLVEPADRATSALTAGPTGIPAGPFDIIVSNPPYITPAEASAMDRQVREYEPHMALFTPDPVAMAAAVIGFAVLALAPGGRLLMELNPLFADAILDRCRKVLPDAALLRDLSGKDRFLEAVRPG